MRAQNSTSESGRHAVGRYSPKYLEDYARELAKIGERAFRRRYTVPVLIIAGRVPARARNVATRAAAQRVVASLDSGMRTVVDREQAISSMTGQVFPLLKAARAIPGPVVVGRTDEPGVDVVIPDLSISKRHCAFVAAADGGWRVTDCGSKNGTRINDAKLDEASYARLCGGESVALGRISMTFETAAGFAEMVSGLAGRVA